MWMNKIKKNELIKARNLCNIDDLNSINNDEEFKSNYYNVYPEELQIGKNILMNMRTVSWISELK